MTQQPPEALGAAHVPVGDDEDALADSGPRSRPGEVGGQGQRVPAAAPGRTGEVFVHVEKRGAGNVTGEVELPPTARRAELPTAVDELVAHRRSLPQAAS